MKQLPLTMISAAIAAILAPSAIAQEKPADVTAAKETNQQNSSNIDAILANEKLNIVNNFHDVIVISGSRMEQTLDEVAGSVVVIDEEAIARNMSTDFATLFRTESAVDVKGGAGKPSSVTIRGIGGNRVMMVKDGVRVNNQYASPLGPGAEGTGRGLTEVEGLKQVEVLKAAASTMYGSDALGGVMVMTTKDADDYLAGQDYYFSANAGYTGMNNEFNGGFTSAFSQGNFDNLVSYQRRQGEEQQNYSNTLPDSDLVTDSVLLKSKYHFNDDTNLQLTVDYLTQQLDRWEQKPHKTDPSKDTSIDYDRKTDALNTSLRLRSTKERVVHDNVDFVLYYGQTDQSEKRNYFNGISAPDREISQKRDYQFNEYRFGFASTFSKALSLTGHDHNIIYGVDIEQSKMSRPRDYQQLDDNGNWIPSDTDTFSFADTKSLRAGAFVQDDITFLDGKLNAILGLRYDYFKNTPDQHQAEDAGRDPADFAAMSDGFWSPKAGLVYHITNNVNVYTQYAYGYKMPTPDQKWGELEVKDGAMPFPVLIQANYDLESESSHTIELGVRGHHGDTQYELTTFYTQADDYIDWEFVGCSGNGLIGCILPRSLEYRYINYDKVTLYGAEASFRQWIGSDVEVWANVAYTHGEDQDGNYLNTVSPLKGNIGANYHTYLGNTELDLGLTVRFADKMDRTTDLDIFPIAMPNMDFNEVFNTSGYAVTDLTANLRINDNWGVRFGVFNVFDKEYIEYADVAGQSKFLMGSLGVTEETYSQPGRYFNIKLNYTF
ncbi:TonB-dependent hemoglobin/transferrin/lactoferrin family receptor [Shewanella aestuarii]|uniref:TonB-dependent hemoglobin/transferrin/lactoferrin family receptor n=1 Tax=Shewanella aestuarii TaxID=1028752 RepID=A0A6G9QN22_9GAMM|nr:TonB-dependent hemoglobin/transferrin/lactoferrin family receptor [Shewanella aestuarii]QIR15483.1 TonB-dependent hemoglobin/transferrin/lactoferrin family receptor [Shewanella aestuarii]